MMDSIAHSLKSFLPAQPKKVYPPVGRCIYCGETDALTLEHVIPFGLGGKIELPDASCRACAKITSDFEHTCLRTMYGPLRLLYGLPSRRKKKRPKKLPLKIKKTVSAEWSYIDLEQEKYPFLILFPYFGQPKILMEDPVPSYQGAVTDRFWIRGASPSFVFKQLLEQLVTELGVYSIMPEAKAHVVEFCQLLFKIAYSFAVGELGYNSLEPYVLPGIIKAELSDCDAFIGSLEKDETPSESLHELSIIEDKQGNHVIVRIRLLAKLGTPTYYVVIGKLRHEKC